jgi:hypothetical protein
LYSNTTDSNGNTVRSVVGVYGIDLVIANMNDNGTISNADVMTSLAKITTCPAMIVSDETLAYFRNSASCTVPLASTSYGNGGKFPMETNKWQYDLAGSFGFIITFAITAAILFKRIEVAHSPKVVLYFILIVVMQLAFGIALVSYTLSTTWDDMIFHKYWKPTNMTVLSTVIDPEICCNIVNCICADYYGESCTAMKDSYQEGYCDQGYHCCAYTSVSCNCDNEGNCQTCTYCIQSVNHLHCSVQCEECYVGKVTWYYEPDETTEDIVQEYKKHCDRGNSADSLICAEEFIAQYQVGSGHDISYNPQNLLDTSPGGTDLPGNYYIVVISLAVCFFLSYLLFIPIFSGKKELSNKDKKVAPVVEIAAAEQKGLLQSMQHIEVQQQQPMHPRPMPQQQQPMSPQPMPQQQQQQQPVNAQQQLLVNGQQQQHVYVQQQQQQQPVYGQQQQPVYAQQQPVFGQQQPVYVQQQPVYGQQQPVYGQQQPVYAQQQPVYGQQQPVYAQQQPVYGQQQPVYAQQQAVYGQQQPVYAQQQPIQHQQQQVTYQ